MVLRVRDGYLTFKHMTIHIHQCAFIIRKFEWLTYYHSAMDVREAVVIMSAHFHEITTLIVSSFIDNTNVLVSFLTRLLLGVAATV